MDELLLRQMPHSTEAEQAVLGSMLIDPSCIADMLELVRPDDFYLQQNKDIFTTIFVPMLLRNGYSVKRPAYSEHTHC